MGWISGPALLRAFFVVLVGGFFALPGLLSPTSDSSPVSEALAAGGTTKVTVMNGLPETLCGPDWHYIINQIDTQAHVPSSIYVSWNGAKAVQVPLTKAVPPGPGNNYYLAH